MLRRLVGALRVLALGTGLGALFGGMAGGAIGGGWGGVVGAALGALMGGGVLFGLIRSPDEPPVIAGGGVTTLYSSEPHSGDRDG